MRGTEKGPLTCPDGTVKETVVVAPAPGTVEVESDGGAAVVEVDDLGTNDPVEVVASPSVPCCAAEQLVTTTVNAARAAPVLALRLMREPIGRRGPAGLRTDRLRRLEMTTPQVHHP